MKSTAPIIIRGKFFSIANFFSADNLSLRNLQISKSIITRGKFNSDSTYRDFVFSNSENQNISNRLQKIKSFLKIDYHYLELNFHNLKYSDGIADLVVYDFDYNEIIKKLDKWGIKKKLSKEEALRIQSTFLNFPRIPQDDFETQIAINLLSQVLSKVDFAKIPKNSVLIISGELLWSRFLTLDLFLNLFKELFKNDLYVLFDERALWECLLSFEEASFLQNLNKTYLLPNLYLVKYKLGLNQIKINFESENKLYTLVKKYNLINLPNGNGFWEDSYLPKHVFINNLQDKTNDKEFEHFNSDLLVGKDIEFIPQTQYLINKIFGVISLYLDESQICLKKIGDWMNENETIGRYEKDIFESLFIPEDSKLLVFNGQIVKRGDPIALSKKKTMITAKCAGKIDSSEIKNGHLKIVKDKKVEEIKSPVMGELLSFNKSSGFTIKSKFKSILLAKQYGYPIFWGRLSYDVNSKESIILYRNLTDFMKDFNKSTIQKFITNQIRGIIISNTTDDELARFFSLSTKTFPFGIAFFMIGNDSQKELKLSLLEENINKYIFIEDTNLLFNQRDDFDMENFSVKRSDNFEFRSEFTIGEIVRFSSFQTNILYGKIIKLPSPKNPSFLIDNGEKIYEVNLFNLMKVSHE